MNFAEGKGPKQAKKPYVMGQFVTIYGQDGAPGGLNAPNPPYSAVISGNPGNALPWSWEGGNPGSAVPGLNLNVNGNGATDISFVCSPGSTESVQDLQSAGVTLFTEIGWSGTCTVTFQGSSSRAWDNYDYTSASWNNISSTTVNGTGFGTFTITPSGGVLYNSYRLIASGTTASGIIDWSIAGMFTDYSAMRIGSNSGDANGNLGQMSIQAPTNYTVQSGKYSTVSGTGWPYSPGLVPNAATKNDADYQG